ncbi:MAG: hypothetical protein KA783_02660 [Chitinophagales bacterium]|jgi:hypothetical protein|nr:hypothetical protein [Sphingobacteriales bacterium]MBP7533321.1 hypothetical protein [Chitinophagales bacterium]
MPIGTNTFVLAPIGILLNPLLAILTASTNFWQKQTLSAVYCQNIYPQNPFAIQNHFVF